MYMRRISPLLLMAALFTACGSKVDITNLTVEMQDGSMPQATATPRFSFYFFPTSMAEPLSPSQVASRRLINRPLSVGTSLTSA